MDWTGVRRTAGLVLAIVFLLAALPASALPAEAPNNELEISLVERVVGWISALLHGDLEPEGLQESLGTGIDPNGDGATTQGDDPSADPELGMGIDPDG